VALGLVAVGTTRGSGCLSVGRGPLRSAGPVEAQQQAVARLVLIRCLAHLRQVPQDGGDASCLRGAEPDRAKDREGVGVRLGNLCADGLEGGHGGATGFGPPVPEAASGATVVLLGSASYRPRASGSREAGSHQHLQVMCHVALVATQGLGQLAHGRRLLTQSEEQSVPRRMRQCLEVLRRRHLHDLVHHPIKSQYQLTLCQASALLDTMDRTRLGTLIDDVRALVEQHYLDPGVAAKISQTLQAASAAGRYSTDERTVADAVTRDLQSVNGDKHLRLVFHESRLPERAPGDDAEEFAAMSRWAEQTCSGIGQVRRLEGNIGYVDIQPVIFPSAISADAITAAFTLIADCEALILDLRGCLGGEPSTVAFLLSHLWDAEPVQLTGMQRRGEDVVRQTWTQTHVPGRRFGRSKAVYVLTSTSTFSGGEAVAYDLQHLGRATVIGEPTRGGAHPREAFRVHPHLEVTIPVARAVNPITGGNWEGVGVIPDISTTAAAAFDAAHRLALGEVAPEEGPGTTDPRAVPDDPSSDQHVQRQDGGRDEHLRQAAT
jgi:hypothetical protein